VGHAKFAIISPNKNVEIISEDYLTISNIRVMKLSSQSEIAIFTAGSATSSIALIAMNLKNKKTMILKKTTDVDIDSSYVSAAQPIEFPTTQNKTAYGYFYPPKNRNFVGLPHELPPLLLHVHGGPTANCEPHFSLNVQYWTSRGWAYMDVNYSGSSRYGREYR